MNFQHDRPSQSWKDSNSAYDHGKYLAINQESGTLDKLLSNNNLIIISTTPSWEHRRREAPSDRQRDPSTSITLLYHNRPILNLDSIAIVKK
jgi:hypothetical protein